MRKAAVQPFETPLAGVIPASGAEGNLGGIFKRCAARPTAGAHITIRRGISKATLRSVASFTESPFPKNPVVERGDPAAAALHRNLLPNPTEMQKLR